MDKRDLQSYQEAAQAGPSSGGSGSSSLQEKYNELDSIFSSQQIRRGSAAQSKPTTCVVDAQLVMENNVASELQSTIEHWRAKFVEGQRKKQELESKKKSLLELRDKQQQMILCAQMDVEGISGKLDAALRNREAIYHKVQHACGLGAALQQHYDAVMNSMSQLTLAKEEQMCESNALLEMFNKMMLEGKLGEQLKEIERLQNELLEVQKKTADKEKEINSRRELNRIRHENHMAQIKKETLEVQAKIQDQRLELAAAKQKRQEIQKRILNISEDDKDVKELANTVSNLEKKINTAVETQLKPTLEENVRLSVLSNDLNEEISAVTGRVQVLEEDKIKTEKEWKVLSEKLVEAETIESNLADELEKTRSMNLEMETQLASRRKILEEVTVAGQTQVSDLEMKLLDIQNINSQHSASLMEQITATRKNCDVVSKKCGEKRDTLSVLKSQFEALQTLHENALKEQQSLDSQLRTAEGEKQRLSDLTEDLKFKISNDEKNQAQLRELLGVERQSAEENEIVLKDKIRATKDETLRINEKITAREENIALLRKNLDEAENSSLKSRELVHNKFNAVIDEQRKKLASAAQKTEAVNQKHQSRANEFSKQLEEFNENLAEMENLLKNLKKTSQTVAEETESLEDNQKKIEEEMEFKKTTENELVEKCKVFERNLQLQITKQSEIAAKIRAEEETLQSKSSTSSELQQLIKKLEKTQAEAAIKNCEEIKEIMHNILETKQTCESLFITTGQLTNEISDLKGNSEMILKEYDVKHSSMSVLDSETESCERKCAKNCAEMDKLSKTTEKLEKKASVAKREALSSNQMYDTMIKGIAAAKSKKAHKDSTAGTSMKSPGRDNKKQEVTGSLDTKSVTLGANKSTHGDVKETQKENP